MESERLKFIVVGAGSRSDSLYIPLLRQLAQEVELVGIFGRSEEPTRRLGEKYRLPWFTDLHRLIETVHPQAAVVSVADSANGQVGRQVVEAGLHVLLETPIAQDLAEADAIIAAGRQAGVKIEVAEQYYRRPMERLKQALIQAGVFGRILTAQNDFMGHGYHGVSLIRSYIGFEAQVLSVNAFEAEFNPVAHYSWVDQTYGARPENWQHGVLRFNENRMGVFNWTSLGYDSSLRWLRSTRFFAEKGMAVGERMTLLSEDGKDICPIQVERFFHNVGGMETLSELAARTDPEIVWRNPLRAYYMDDEMIAVADCLLSLVQAIRENRDPEYGALQARLDQEVVLAMRASSESNGDTINLPLNLE
jgi:predicted dehydrogenase